jgi:RNA polymerase sigma factor (sigma-70 family)
MAMKYRQLLLDNLDMVERLTRFVARRHHLSRTDADEFAGIVRLRLVEDDFAVLRKFEGRSALSTYLTVVIERLCQDYSIAQWGKWRPSAAARRLGAAAILLERLVVCDGATFDEAVDAMRTNHGVDATPQELWELFAQLPVRTTRWNASRAPRREGEGFSDPAFLSHEAQHEAERVSLALADAVAALSPSDQRLIKLRFEQGLAVTQIAAITGENSRLLYRRLQWVIRTLRLSLEAHGVGAADLGVVGQPTLLLRRVLPET